MGLHPYPGKPGLACHRPRLQGWALHFEFRQAAAAAEAGDATAAQAHLEAAGAAAAAQGMPDLQVSCHPLAAQCFTATRICRGKHRSRLLGSAGGVAPGCSCARQG